MNWIFTIYNFYTWKWLDFSSFRFVVLEEYPRTRFDTFGESMLAVFQVRKFIWYNYIGNLKNLRVEKWILESYQGRILRSLINLSTKRKGCLELLGPEPALLTVTHWSHGKPWISSSDGRAIAREVEVKLFGKIHIW